MNLIRACEHIAWSFWKKIGIKPDEPVHKRFSLPLGAEDFVYTPNTHHVYIFETKEEKKTVIWYRWSGLVAVNGELYSLIDNTNLFESYAWLVHDECKAEYILVKETPMEVFQRETQGKVNFIGANIDRDTGMVITSEYHTKCFTIAVKKRATTVPWYKLNTDELMKPPIRERLNSSVICVQRWMRRMLQNKIPAMQQIKHRGIFKTLPEDVFAIIEYHYHRCLQPRQIQREFRFDRPEARI